MSSSASRFLRGLARYLNQLKLYDREHDAVREAGEEAYRRLLALVDERGSAAFSFFPGEVVLGSSPLAELSGWAWSGRLAEADVRRIEVTATPDREEWEAFAEALAARVLGDDPASEEEAARRWSHLQYGPLAVADRRDEESEEVDPEEVDWAEEAEMADWILETVRNGGDLPVLQVLTLIESAALGLTHLAPGGMDFAGSAAGGDDDSMHALRVALLSHRLAAGAGGGPAASLRLGTAGFLHDVGRVVPKPRGEVSGPGEVDPHHTVVGCRFLLGAGEEFGTAAVVALEHHRWWGGGGEPDLHYESAPCRATRVVQVADRYDTLLARSDEQTAARELVEEAGTRLEPELVEIFRREVLADEA